MKNNKAKTPIRTCGFVLRIRVFNLLDELERLVEFSLLSNDDKDRIIDLIEEIKLILEKNKEVL